MQVRQWTAGVAAAALVASGAALVVADRASAVGGDRVSTRADGRVGTGADGRVGTKADGQVAAGATVLRFDEFPVGTTITDQYAPRGVLFAGAGGAASPFISPDGAAPTSPVLSGAPRFVGAIAGSFVVPGTSRPATVDRFSLDVGYIDTPGSVGVTVYDAAGGPLGTVLADRAGTVTLTSTFSGAARFVVAPARDEPAGFGIDNLSFTVVRTLAALGDSYSSGEGAGAYEPASGGCHRTALAWPRLLDADEDAAVRMVAHLACSGAQLQHLVRPFTGQAAQLRALGGVRPAPDLVTITIGGNDLGVADVLTDCFGSDCAADRRVDSVRAVLTRNLGPALTRAYRQVAAAVPAAEVVVVGYPRLLPETRAETVGCGWLEPAEQVRLNDLAAALDQVARTSADAAGVRYASVLAALDGHELCSSESWVYPVGLFGGPERGHPRPAGQQAVAGVVRAFLAAG